MLILPVTNDPAQEFTTQLGGAKYTFYLKYNEISGVYSMDISDPVTNTLLLAGVALVSGVNLMGVYNLALSNLTLVDMGLEAASGPATVDDMGDRLKLIWVSDVELN